MSTAKLFKIPSYTTLNQPVIAPLPLTAAARQIGNDNTAISAQGQVLKKSVTHILRKNPSKYGITTAFSLWHRFCDSWFCNDRER